MTAPTLPPPAGAGQTTDLTRTCQNDAEGFTSVALIAALEQAWAAIRTRHPEVPAAVVVVGSGSPAKASQSMKWGHFDAHRWQAGTDRLPEVLISGEGLRRPATEVFTTLLHEAVHGLADTRGIKDTSRQGRWHNKHFARLAAELGMSTRRDDKLGYSPCTLTEVTTGHYQPVIDTLATVLRGWRHPNLPDTKERTTNNNGHACLCDCGRKLRVSVSTFDDGPILCAACGSAFLPEDIDRDTYEQEHPYTVHTGPCTTTATTGERAPDSDTDNTADAVDDPEDDMVFYDPTGERYGIPTYPYRMAPAGLATTRQLRARGLRPGGQHPAAQILWRRGKRTAYLYRIDAAKPKRTATAAQLAALARALLARRTCPTCGQIKDYYIPRRHGECHDCTPAGRR